MRKVSKILIVVLLFLLCMSSKVMAKESDKQSENFANIVFFVYCSGTDEEKAADIKYFEDNTDSILNVYNGTQKRSFTNYLKEISYGKFNVKNIFPQLQNGKIVPLELNMDIASAYDRTHDENIVKQIVAKYPSIGNEVVDYNNDGCIDNITVIIKTRSDYDKKIGTTFTSRKKDFSVRETYLNKAILSFNLVGTNSIDTNKSAVLVHEFLHTLGYPDLYRGSSSGADDLPVYIWDIMASANARMPYPLAFFRKEITNWIDIDTITESTNSLRLDLQTNKDGNQAYILKSPLNDYEFFVVEYRRKEDSTDENKLDGLIGGSGVIVYRIDTTATGYSNFYGGTVAYIFRPKTGESETSKVLNAYLSADSGRTTIGTSDLNKGFNDGALTYSDGSNSGIVIKNVSSAGGDYMTLDVEIPNGADFDLWKNLSYPDDIATNPNLVYKNFKLVKHNNKLYAVSYYGNSVYTKVLENNSWVSKGSASTVQRFDNSNVDVLELNNEIYLVTQDYNNINIYKWNDSANSWSLFSSISEATNEIKATVANNKIYVVATNSTEAMLYVLNNTSLSKIGVYHNELNGNPEIAELKGDIYVTTRGIDQTIYLYKYNSSDNSFTKIETGITRNTYDIKATNGKLYIVAGKDAGDSKMLVKAYDGTKWEEINSPIELSFTNIIVSQGNLYVLGSNNNSLYVYSIDENKNEFVQEGNIVDTGIQSYETSLVAIDNKIYVGIRRSEDNKLLVKCKETVNSLVSLTVTPPTKLLYVVGESVDKTGLKVVANYTHSQKEVTDYTVSNFSATKVGNFVAVVTFEGKTKEFAYEVVAKNEETSTDDPPVQEYVPLKNGVYIIRSALNNGMVLDLNGGKAANKSNIQLYKFNNSLAQKWNITYLGDRCYKITTVVNSGYSLDVNGASSANGANIQVYKNNNGNAQKWILEDAGNGYYYIISKCNNKNVDVKGGKTANRTNIQIYQSNASNAQKFKLEYVDTTVKDGVYVIHSALNNNMVLDVKGGKKANKTNVQLYKYNKSAAQKWHIKNLGNGYYEITTDLDSGKFSLDVSGASSANGTNVQIYSKNGSNAQKWILRDAGKGYYYIISKCGNKCLDVSGGRTSNGTNIQIYSFNDTNAQKFKLEKIK